MTIHMAAMSGRAAACYCSSLSSGRCDFCTGLREAAASPTCSVCHKPFDHGCNSPYCGESCEQEAEAIHERAHAGVSDPDACLYDDACPLNA